MAETITVYREQAPETVPIRAASEEIVVTMVNRPLTVVRPRSQTLVVQVRP